MNPQSLSFFLSISLYRKLLLFLSAIAFALIYSPSIVLAATGGPDSGNYTFQDSVEPGCNTTLTDISGTGTALNLSDDGDISVTMPFPFEFYDITYSDIVIGNNGGIIFTSNGSGHVSASNNQLPSSNVSGPALVPYWDDIDSYSGNVYYETVGIAPNRQFIVQWHDRPHYSFGGAVTFQAVLYENTNAFDFVYEDVIFGSPSYDAGASATIGIQESVTGPGFLQYSYNDSTLLGSGVTALCFNKGNLSKLVNVDEALPGDPITYTLMLQNPSNDTLTNIVVTDTFPTSVTVTSITSSGFSITETNTQPYVWQVSDIVSGGSGMITIMGVINDDPALLGTTIVNSASITGIGLIDRTPVVATVSIPAPDLSASYKEAPRFLTSDGMINYLINLENSSIITAANTMLTDPIPTDTLFIAGSVTGGATYNTTLDQIEWIGDIEPISGITISYAVSVTAIPPVIITNTATIVQTFLPMPLLLTTRTQAVTSRMVDGNFCVDFEEGQFPGFMLAETTQDGTAIGRAEVSAQFAHSGDYALHLDTEGSSGIYSSGFTTQAAIMILDLSAVAEADLRFWLYNHDDEYHPSQDGLFISNDGGATYTQILSFHNVSAYRRYVEVSVDLVDFVTSQGMALTSNTLLKFQSYDNTSLTEDGFSIDDICLTVEHPEIEVAGNGVPIADNSVIPNMANNTEFGAVPIFVGRVEHTFTIHNTGTGNLLIDSVTIDGPHAGSFEIVQQPSIMDLAVGLTTDFRVAFSTTVAALRQAMVNIISNDDDESLYNFNIQGRGIVPPSVGDGSIIRIESFTQTVGFDPFTGPESFSVGVEGVALSGLKQARFEIIINSGSPAYIQSCLSGASMEVITCETNGSGRTVIQIGSNSDEGISGDGPLFTLEIQPFTNDGIVDLEIAPIAFVNSDGIFIEPILEHGQIILVPEPEPTETPIPPTDTPTSTPLPTETPTVTETSTEIPTETPTATEVPTETPTMTALPTETDTATPTPTPLPTETPTAIPTETPTETATETATETPTVTVLPTETDTVTPTPTPLPTETPTAIPTETATPTPTLLPTDTPTIIPTVAATLTDTATPTDIVAPAPTPIPIDTPTAIPTVTDTPSPTATIHPSTTPENAPTISPSETPVNTPTSLPTQTETPTLTVTVTDTSTPTPTPTLIPTDTLTPTPTVTDTPIPTDTPTSEPTITPTATPTTTPTPTLTPTLIPTATHTSTPRPAQLTGEIQADQTALQPGSEARYSLSIQNQGGSTAENVSIQVILPDEFQLAANQLLAWAVLADTENIYELPIGTLTPNSRSQTFILLALDADIAEDATVQTPGIVILADGDVEPFRIEVGAGANILVEANEDLTPTNLDQEEEPQQRIFLPIIQR